MKRIFTAMKVVALLVIVTVPLQSFAQAPDTVWVPASPQGNINAFISGDTLVGGIRKNSNRVYELYNDSIYYYTATIFVADYNLTIISPVPGSGHYPAEINPTVTTTGATSAQRFIEVTRGGNGTGNVTLKYLYLQGVRYDEATEGGSRVIAVDADSGATIRVDSCVLDGWYFRCFGDGGTEIDTKYFITNNIFMNCMAGGSYFDGQGFGVLSPSIVDTLWIRNNTFFLMSSYIVLLQSGSFCKYMNFTHNTVYTTFVNPLWIFEAVNGDIENNIFYGTLAVGEIPAETASGYYDLNGQLSSVISLDTLTTISAKYNILESDRHINIFSNDYYWPKQMTDFWTHWDDSVSAIHADSEYITHSLWMNQRTLGMFGNRTMWPNLDSANNVSVDPDFSSSVSGQVDSLVQQVYNLRSGKPMINWWYIPQANITNGQDGPFPAVWPLPWSLTYANSQLMTAGTDGKPLGDLRWFPEFLAVHQTSNAVPAKFELSQNYPNPFNPSTQIKASLNKSGLMSLKIYNVLGQVVKVVDQGFKQAGSYTYDLSMEKYASGVYFYSLQQGGNMITKKLVLLK